MNCPPYWLSIPDALAESPDSIGARVVTGAIVTSPVRQVLCPLVPPLHTMSVADAADQVREYQVTRCIGGEDGKGVRGW